MAHYAYLNANNIVTSVIVGRDDGDIDWEIYYGNGSPCKKTSYNTRGGIYYTPNTNTPDLDQSKAFRKNYAGIDYTYDDARNAFIPPQMFPSWVLDEFSCLWKAPIPYPTDGKVYSWNETTQSWDLVDGQ